MCGGVGAILCGLFMEEINGSMVLFWGSVMSAKDKTEKLNGTAQNQNQKAHSPTGHGVANRLTTEKSNLWLLGIAINL
jgi:hypothetical protein